MTQPLAPTLPADDAPDLRCPLCEYNLRGLAEPRCPECGHRFDPDELRDRQRWQHEWLFEHQSRRGIASFVRTFATSMLPQRFWRSVRPVNKPVVGRIMLYWTLVTALVIAGAWFGTYAPGVRQYISDIAYYNWSRREHLERIAQDEQIQAALIQHYGSIDAFLASILPPRPSLRIILFPNPYRGWWIQQTLVPYTLAMLAWPWLTVGALLLFRASLRQAQIKSVHVVRCAVYSADVVVFAGIVIAIAPAAEAWRMSPPGPWYEWLMLPSVREIAPPLAIMLTLFSYRLWIAYRKYLAFPHAFATVFASQVIVGLIVLKLFMVWQGH